MPTKSSVWNNNNGGEINDWNGWSVRNYSKSEHGQGSSRKAKHEDTVLKKVKKFWKKQKGKLKLNFESEPYESFVNAEGEDTSRMEFGMEVTLSQVDERIAFGSMAKGQKRYGSTARHLKRDDSQGFVYTVQKGDTLQGLAVKFGITTEQIRRTNQLWTNDSLFLRDKLIIPIQVENGGGGDDGLSYTSSIVSPTSNSSERHSHATATPTTNGSTTTRTSSSTGNPSNTPHSLASPHGDTNFQSPESMSTGSKHWTHPLSDSFEYDDGLTTPDSIKLDSDSHSLPSPNSCPVSYANHNLYQNGDSSIRNGSSSDKDNSPTRRYLVKDHSEKSVDEFLSRIDSAIASTREKTLPLAQNGKQWVTFESDSESDQHFHRSSSSRTSNLSDGRVLRHSLRNLEKRQEELFQL